MNKKKVILSLLLVVLIIISTLALVACQETIYNIKFVSDGIECSATQKVMKQGKAIEPKSPTKDHYIFLGWFDGDTQYDFDKVVESDLTLSAKWEKCVTVTYRVEGEDDVVMEFRKSEKAINLAHEYRLGFIFSWYLGDTAYEFTNSINDDIILVGVYTETETCTAQFNSLGGSDVPAQTVNVDNTIVKPEAPNKAGFDFGGWFKDEETQVPFDFETQLTEDIVIYARWISEYTVQFETFGAGNIDDQTVSVGETIILPVAPVKAHHSFVGWFIDADLTTQYVPSLIESNMTLYAKYDIYTFSVSYETFSKGSVDSVVVEYGQTVGEPTYNVPEDWNFLGWYSDAACTQIFDFNTEITRDTVIYANLEAKIYVTYTAKAFLPVEDIPGEYLGETSEMTLDADYTGSYFDLLSGDTTNLIWQGTAKNLQIKFDGDTEWTDAVWSLGIITMEGEAYENEDYILVYEEVVINVFSFEKGKPIYIDSPVFDDFDFNGWYRTAAIDEEAYVYSDPIITLEDEIATENTVIYAMPVEKYLSYEWVTINAKYPVFHGEKLTYYTVRESGWRIVANAEKAPAEIILPDYYSKDGKTGKVISLGERAFDGRNLTHLKGIVVPKTIVEFYSSKMDPKDTSNNYNYATFNTTTFEYIYIMAERVEFCNYTIYSPINLAEIRLPIYQDVIPNGFLTSGSVTDEQFKVKFEELVIPNSVHTIGNKGFSMLNGLKTLYLSKNALNIAEAAFYQAATLQNVYLNEDFCPIIDFDLIPDYTKVWGNPARSTTSLGVFYAGTPTISYGDLVSIEIPEGVEIIGSRCFTGQFNLTNVILPNSLKTIGYAAFSSSETTVAKVDEAGLKNLTQITFPQGLEVIGENAFAGSGLTSSSGLTSINITSSVVTIDRKAFYCCYSLTDLEFGENSVIEEIGQEAFRSSGLVEVTLPESVITIKNQAFYDSVDLQNINLEKIVYMGQDAFRNCSSLVSADLSNLVYFCLPTAVNADTGDFNAATGQFNGCTSLQTITLDKVIKIGNTTFSNCSSLVSVSLPASLIDLSATAFSGCISLRGVVVNEVNTVFKAIENVLYKVDVDAEDNEILNIVLYPYGRADIETGVPMTVYNVPINLVSLPKDVFASSSAFSNVEKIIFAQGSKTQTYQYTFAYLKNLTEIDMSGYDPSITVIGNYQSSLTINSYYFYETENLTTIKMPYHFISFPAYTFTRCGIKNLDFGAHLGMQITTTNLFYQSMVETVIFPDSVNALPNNTFREANCLKSIRFARPNVDGEGNALGTYTLIDIDTTHIGTYEINTEYHLDLRNITSFGSYCFGAGNGVDVVEEGIITQVVNGVRSVSLNSVDEITTGNNMFQTMHDLSAIDLGTIINLPTYMFENCISLSTIDISNVQNFNNFSFKNSGVSSIDFSSATNIGTSAFENCVNLTEIDLTLPSYTATSIGNAAFAGCISLTTVTGLDNDNWAKGNVTTLPQRIFADSKITSLFIPKSITTLVYHTSGITTAQPTSIASSFSNLKLTEVTVHAENTTFKVNNGALYDFDVTTLHIAFCANAEGLFEVPSTVTTFKNIPFAFTVNLKEVRFLVEEDGSCAINATQNIPVFALAQELEEIHLPNKITSITANGYFHSTTSLQVLEAPGVTNLTAQYLFNFSGIDSEFVSSILPKFGSKIPNYTFANCLNIDSVELISQITEIGTNAFLNCVNIQFVNIGQVTKIGESAFQDCMFEFISMDKVTDIGKNAFANCTNLKYVDFSSVINIGDSAFKNSGLKTVKIIETTKKIDAYAFADCADLETVVIQTDNNQLLSRTSGTVYSKYDHFTRCPKLDNFVLIYTGTVENGHIIYAGVSSTSNYFRGGTTDKDIAGPLTNFYVPLTHVSVYSESAWFTKDLDLSQKLTSLKGFDPLAAVKPWEITVTFTDGTTSKQVVITKNSAVKLDIGMFEGRTINEFTIGDQVLESSYYLAGENITINVTFEPQA